MWYNRKAYSKLKGNIYWGVFILLLGCAVAQSAERSVELDQLRTMWKSGLYAELFPLLLTYREGPYGEDLEVDYMIATTACRITEQRENGRKYFQWILYSYDLDKKARKLVEDEMQRCGPANQPIIIVYAGLRSSAGVRGKTFYWLDAKSALASSPVQVVRDIPVTEFEKRLIQVDDNDSAVKQMKDLLGPQIRVDSAGLFSLASLSGHSQSDLHSVAGRLERVLQFFTLQYKMPAPSYLITIYLVPNTWELTKLAEKLHGIRVSEASIGYSFREDLSIIGMIPRDDTYVGTLAHELFHLMVRNNFGDIPPWMDEGMAALYEVHQITGDSVIGLPNWRGDVLERFWNERPPIDKLVKMDWRSLDAADFGGEQREKLQATNHATARYFMLYLQENKKLTEVYEAFRNRKVEEMQKDPGTDATNLLASILKKPLNNVDQDFSLWFKQLASKIQKERMEKKKNKKVGKTLDFETRGVLGLGLTS